MTHYTDSPNGLYKWKLHLFDEAFKGNILLMYFEVRSGNIKDLLQHFQMNLGKHQSRLFHHGSKTIPLTISVGARLSSRIAGHLTRILLEDALSYENVVLVPDSSPDLKTVENLRNETRCRNTR
jgi:hypothetical protein